MMSYSALIILGILVLQLHLHARIAVALEKLASQVPGKGE